LTFIFAIIELMPNPAEGPITIYAPNQFGPNRPNRPNFRSKLRLIFSVLLALGLAAASYPFADQVWGVLTQGGSAITLDKVLDESFNLSLAGYFEGTQFKSTVTSGAPFIVVSTGLVANLNADLLDGQHGSYYLDLSSLDGVSSNGGNIDLLAGANITLTPDDINNTIEIAAAGGGGGGDADTLEGQTGSYYLDLDNETGTCANCLTTTEINESTFTGLNGANIADIYLLNTGDTASGNYSFDAGTLFVDSTGNQVGIGTASPSGFGVMTIDGGVRLRNDSDTRYRSDWSVGADGLSVNAFDDTGGAYLPVRIDGLSFALRADASDAKSITLDNTGQVGIGTATPDASSLLNVFKEDDTGTQALLTTGVFDLFLYADDNVPATNIYNGVQGRTRYYGIAGETAYSIRAVRGSMVNLDAGTVVEASGTYSTVANESTGTIERAIGFYNPGIANTSTGTIDNAYGLLVGSVRNEGGGTLTTNYGVFIENQVCATCGTSFALYSQAGDNYFGGAVEIGGDTTINNYLKTTLDATNAVNMFNNGISLESYLDVGVYLDNEADDVGEAFRVFSDGGLIELLTVDDSEFRAIQPAFFESGAFTGLATGTLGYLSVLEDYGAGGIARIVDLTATDDAGVSVLRLGLGTANAGTASRFVTFYADATGEDDGTGVGRIRLNAGNVAYETGGADYAEYVDVSGSVEQGDIIALASSKGKKAVSGERTIGVVSGTAGFVGNAKSEAPGAGQAVVGFLGQILTKVSGEIEAGDLVAASDTPGVGVRAAEKGPIVGVAVEGHNGSGVSKIKVFVNPGWYDPETEITSEGIVEAVIPDQLHVLGVEAEEGVFEKITASVLGTFEKLVAKTAEIASAVFENLKVKFLTIGESAAPTGITIYDRATGEPYCVSVNEGAVVAAAGVCE
jgi:hypothetical protein